MLAFEGGTNPARTLCEPDADLVLAVEGAKMLARTLFGPDADVVCCVCAGMP